MTDRPHINADGEFQSDKYPTCPPGKVPLSVKDPAAQDLLFEYAQRRRGIDAEFSVDLEYALAKAGFDSTRDRAIFAHLVTARRAERQAAFVVVRWMDAEAKAGRIRQNNEAPGWDDYMKTSDAWHEALRAFDTFCQGNAVASIG